MQHRPWISSFPRLKQAPEPVRRILDLTTNLYTSNSSDNFCQYTATDPISRAKRDARNASPFPLRLITSATLSLALAKLSLNVQSLCLNRAQISDKSRYRCFQYRRALQAPVYRATPGIRVDEILIRWVKKLELSSIMRTPDVDSRRPAKTGSKKDPCQRSRPATTGCHEWRTNKKPELRMPVRKCRTRRNRDRSTHDLVKWLKYAVQNSTSSCLIGGWCWMKSLIKSLITKLLAGYYALVYMKHGTMVLKGSEIPTKGCTGDRRLYCPTTAETCAAEYKRVYGPAAAVEETLDVDESNERIPDSTLLMSELW